MNTASQIQLLHLTSLRICVKYMLLYVDEHPCIEN